MTSIRQVQHVIEEFVGFIPQADPIATHVVHGRGNPKEMFEELDSDIFVDRVLPRQFQRDSHQIQGKHPHPAGGIALFKMTAPRKRGAPIENTDIIQSEKAALEDVSPSGVFAVDPPGEVEQKLVKDGFQEGAIALAGVLLLYFINAPGSPS